MGWLARTRTLPTAVLVLGLASLLTDISGEMIYPLLPAFLADTLGASAWALGLIEGCAEATAAVFKIASGIWTDRAGTRKPLVVLGYGLSGIIRPLMGLAPLWPVVLALRVGDRIGKGLRGSPRDALIADVTAPEQRGAAYGVHQAMDHAGAVLGPLGAALLLSTFGWSVRQVFLLAALPGIAVILVLWLRLREPDKRQPQRPPGAPRLLPYAQWPPALRRLLLAVTLFSLGNSADAFLLLRVHGAGVPLAWTAALWAAHHVVKMGANWVGGNLADSLGRRPMVLGGWAIYAAVYLGFALVDSLAGTVALFLAYGLYFGLCEPAEKAWIADLAPAGQRGAAFGVWQAAVGLGALPASLLFGALWSLAGPAAAFGTGAAFAATAALLLLRVQPAASA